VFSVERTCDDEEADRRDEADESLDELLCEIIMQQIQTVMHTFISLKPLLHT